MKAILIAAAALMTGASIYGFIDYNKKSGSREFKALYQPEKKEVPPAVIEEKKPQPKPGEPAKEKLSTEAKTEKSVKAKRKPRKARKISFESFSRARIEKFEAPASKEND